MKRILSFILALVMLTGSFVFTATADTAPERDLTSNNKMAADLKALGLFRGVSATDFDLDRAPSRIEAMVILIRLLGKESAALNGSWEHPFTDVPEWADRYIGYAYKNGLTNGISATEFGTSDASAATFFTFVLRALGYSDANGADFTWSDPFSLAKEVGILTEDVDTETFWRADAVTVSYNALSANIKGTNGTLAKKLIADGAFTAEQYASVFGSEEITLPEETEGAETEPPASDTEDTENAEQTESPKYAADIPDEEISVYSPSPIEPISIRRNKKSLSAKEAYEKCAPFIFSITTYDVGGYICATASGFLLNTDGLAVTNLHVFYDALSATATFMDGTVYDIEGVVGIDAEKDCVLIQLKGNSFPAPSLGDSNEIEIGDAIFTIGSPKGLSETISTGIISSVSREDYSGFIQITAPISAGSSGGALINEYGEVIGITAGTIADSQNLNFAVPINVAYDAYDKVLEDDEAHMVTFKVLAWILECMRVSSAKQPFTSNYNEAEPNDTPEQAYILPNSRSAIGSVYKGDTDCYLIRCSCEGTVTLLMICPTMVLAMGGEDAKDRKMSDFTLELLDPETGKIISTAEIMKDQSSGIEMVGMTTVAVPEPGIYEIRVALKDTVATPTTYEDGTVGNVVFYDYALYFLFIPNVEQYLSIVE